MSSNVWLQVRDLAGKEQWVRGDQVIAIQLSRRAGVRDPQETYGLGASWFTHDRTSSDLIDGLESRTEAMSMIRRVLELLASPPEIVGLISLDTGGVHFESFSDEL